MKTYAEIKTELYARSFDVDGAYGGQCWDGFARYCQLLGYPYANCTASGYVKDLYEQRNTNGMLKNFTLVSVMQAGDICVFKVSKSCPLSHVAIFDHDAGSGYGWFLGMNQNGVSQFTLTKLPYCDTYDYAFRPNCFIKQKETVPNFTKETGIFYPNTTLKIRKSPSLSGEDTGLVYTKGMSVMYEGYVKAEGYVWITWKSAKSGERRWMAAGKLNTVGINSEPFGVFK